MSIRYLVSTALASKFRTISLKDGCIALRNVRTWYPSPERVPCIVCFFVASAGSSASKTGGTRASQAPAVVKSEPTCGETKAAPTVHEQRALGSASEVGKLRGKQAGGHAVRAGKGAGGQRRAVTVRVERVRRGMREALRDEGRAQRREERERRKDVMAKGAEKGNPGSKGNRK